MRAGISNGPEVAIEWGGGVNSHAKTERSKVIISYLLKESQKGDQQTLPDP